MSASPPDSKRVILKTDVPSEWWPKIKEKIEKGGYPSRAEWLRALVRREVGIDG